MLNTTIIGQQKLLAKIDLYDLYEFPRTIMLVGEHGSGRHLIASYIADRLQLEVEDITDSISLDTIQDITVDTETRVYVIDMSKVSIKEENTMLKFLEEPPLSAYIVLIAENTESILPTVLNRCQVLNMDKYNKAQLLEFLFDKANANETLNYVNTPGQVKALMSCSVEDMIKVANNIVVNIGRASFANALKLSQRIAFKEKEEGAKFDFTIFIRVLTKTVMDYMLQYNNQKLTDAYFLTSQLNRNSRISHIDKKILFENYLLDLKHIMGEKNC